MCMQALVEIKGMDKTGFCTEGLCISCTVLCHPYNQKSLCKNMMKYKTLKQTVSWKERISHVNAELSEL